MTGDGTVDLHPYAGEWTVDDPDANFKQDVATYSRLDPLPTFRQLSKNTGIPVGALVRYVLVKWAAEGSDALLALGPRTVERLWAHIERAETDGSEAARLEAYHALREMLSWLRLPLTTEAGERRGS